MSGNYGSKISYEMHMGCAERAFYDAQFTVALGQAQTAERYCTPLIPDAKRLGMISGLTIVLGKDTSESPLDVDDPLVADYVARCLSVIDYRREEMSRRAFRRAGLEQMAERALEFFRDHPVQE